MSANEDATSKASECPVCLETYVDPRMLTTCGHSVCADCVQKLIEAPPNPTSVTCPECREVSQVPNGGFPRNFRLAGEWICSEER